MRLVHLTRLRLRARQFVLIVAAILAVLLSARLQLLPPLLSTAISDQALDAAHREVLRTEQELEQARRAAVPVEGPRGDFERRGAEINKLPPDQRADLLLDLARDARLIQALAQAGERYREALVAYHNSLLASTRELGPRSEELRPLTWPVAAQVMPYPPPRGNNVDFRPPSSPTIAAWANRMEASARSGSSDGFAAARELGRSTFSLKQLLEYDARYRRQLDKYAAELKRVLAAGPEAQLTISHPALWTPESAVQAEPLVVPDYQRVLAVAVLVVLALLLAAGLLLTSEAAESAARNAQPFVLAGAAALLLYVVPQPPLVVLAAAALVLVFVRWPATALALIPATIPFYYRPLSVASLSFPPSEAMLLLALLAAALRMLILSVWRGPGQVLAEIRPGALRRLAREPLLLCALLVGLAGFLALLSPLLVEVRPALRELRRMVIEPLLFFGLLCVAQPADRPLALKGFLVSAAIVAADALIQALLGRGMWRIEGLPRLLGLLPSPTALGVVVGAALAAALAGAAQARQRDLRLGYALFALPLAATTVATFTRGAWLGVAAAAITVLALRAAWRPLIAIGGAPLVVAVVLLGSSSERLQLLLRLKEGTGAARIQIWTTALRLLSHSPLFGIGLDQFARQDLARFGLPPDPLQDIAHPHNVLLDVWLQLGLLGLLATLLATVIAIWRLARGSARHALWSLPAVAVLVYLFVHGAVDQTLLGGALPFLFWACVGLALPAVPAPSSAVEHP